MGPGKECPEYVSSAAYALGGLIAKEGWVVLSGGRDQGVMDAVSRGAKAAGGTTIGILPAKDSSISEAVDIAIITDINFARNNINVVTSDIVVSCGMGVGTASEIGLALSSGKHVVMLHSGEDALQLFGGLRPLLVHRASSGEEVVQLVKRFREGAL